MIRTDKDGMHYTIPDEWAAKLARYEKIVEVLKNSDPFHGNRETCNKIRRIVKEAQNGESDR